MDKPACRRGHGVVFILVVREATARARGFISYETVS